MTRLPALFFLLLALTFSGCKKNKTAASAQKPDVVASQEAGAPAAAAPAAGEPPPPEKPDFTPAAATPKPAAKQAIDTNASVVAFCYHNIEDGSKMKALTIPVEQFEQEMQAIKDAGFTVIPMQDFLAWRRGEKNIPHKSCLITIDDGWVSGYNNAWPVLKKHGYPFTMFIYVNYVGSGGKSLSWAQLEEMRDAGVDIECHTWYHGNLKAPGKGVDATTAALIKKDIAALGVDGYLRKEIVDSKKKLEQQLGIRVNVLAYPFGNWNAKARELVKEAGYEAAFTVYGQRLTRSSQYDLLGRYAIEAAKPKIFTDGLAMIGGGGGTPDESASSVGQLAAASMVTQPLNNETIMNPQPLIKANLSTMGEIEPGSLKVRLSGVGPLNAQFNPETKMMTAQVTQKLRPETYTVLISASINGVPSETRWSFTVAPSAGSVLSSTPAPAAAPPAAAPDAATPAPAAAPAKATPKGKKK